MRRRARDGVVRHHLRVEDAALDAGGERAADRLDDVRVPREKSTSFIEKTL